LSCSKKNADVPDTVPVSGKVTADGQPVSGGNVSFLAFDKEQKTGAMIAGQIDSTGGYVLFTGGKEGAPPGRYKVTVSPSMMPTGDNKMPTMPFNTKFSDALKTPLVVTVSANAPPGTYDLKLTK
jgi:hypothetical protein